MLPPLQSDGTLPPGTYDATPGEVLAAYPARNPQRQMLNGSLQVVVEQLWRLDPTLVILVDGSYVTAKAEPNDIDLLLITATYTELAIQQYLDQMCPVEAVSVHLYAEPQLPSALLTFLTTTPLGRPKGIIQLRRPERGWESWWEGPIRARQRKVQGATRSKVMRSVQPPITSEEEYHGYQQGRDTLTAVVREREQRLIEALASADEALIEARRYELLHVLADRQGIIDAIKAYEQRKAQSA